MPVSDLHSTTRTAYLPLKAVKVSLVQQMYQIHERTHEHACFDAFTQELKRQSGVLLVRCRGDERIVGFCTQSVCTVAAEGELVRGLFTGPAIIDSEYRALHGLRIAMFRRLFLERLKRPMAPFYWFFTAPSVNDYLQMTQRFPHHYPDIAGSAQRDLCLAQAFGAHLFPHAFDKHRMLVDFAEGHVRPKTAEAEVPVEARQRAFFEGLNPTWRSGTELPCLAECDWTSLWRGMQGRMMVTTPSTKRIASRAKRGQPS